MDPAPTRYLDRDGAALAYQVVGEGPHDVVSFLEINQHLDLAWTDPHMHHLFERGTTYSRTVYLQRRGFGLSEPISYAPTIEQQADDVLAVMDAVGMERATLYGIFGTCPALAMVAARHPERVVSLVLMGPIPQGLGTPMNELIGWTEQQADTFVSAYAKAFDAWGSGRILELWDTSLGTAYNRRLGGLLERCSATPAAARAYFEWVLALDATEVFRSVRVPTRVLRMPTNSTPEAAVRHVARLIPGATYHELPPTPPGASVGESVIPAVDHIQEAVTGTVRRPEDDRALAAVLFTDVVGSTALLAEVGDVAYQEVLASYHRLVRLEADQAGGEVVSTTGDGALCVFPGPTQAVRCAQAVVAGAPRIGLQVRAGVHVGEVTRKGQDLTGLAVHVGARVGAAASPGEVLVSRAVKDLVPGSGLVLRSAGTRELRGVPGSWELYALEGAAATPAHDARPRPTVVDRAVVGTARRAPRMMRGAVAMANAVQRRRAR